MEVDGRGEESVGSVFPQCHMKGYMYVCTYVYIQYLCVHTVHMCTHSTYVRMCTYVCTYVRIWLCTKLRRCVDVIVALRGN